jgi:ferric-dicitrate binding protein FerR (iron transport regulator)
MLSTNAVIHAQRSRHNKHKQAWQEIRIVWKHWHLEPTPKRLKHPAQKGRAVAFSVALGFFVCFLKQRQNKALGNEIGVQNTRHRVGE